MSLNFDSLNFNSFRNLAQDKHISESERVGFPNAYREGKSDVILEDILSKLSILSTSTHKRVLEIGPGASELTEHLLDFCQGKDHQAVFVDSQEMLSLIKGRSYLTKIPGCFPDNFDLIKELGPYDAILVYSVVQYPFEEGNVWSFIDHACSLLAEGGQLLIGDIPNTSKRKRFFASTNGTLHHQKFTNSDEVPVVEFNKLELNKIDDGVLIGIIARLRSAGFHAYIVPQSDNLPMANRREDILIQRP